MTLSPADDLRHRPAAPGARTRDSLFWQLALPARRLAVQCYLFLSGTDSCGWHVAVWGDGERHAFETGFMRLADEADLDDVAVDGLLVQQPDPLRTSRIALDRPALSIELAFTGSHAPFSYRDNPDGLPPWFAVDRYEQTGRLRGTLRLGDDTISIDHPGHRDHSWGVRDWTAPLSWVWFIAYTASGHAVQGWTWRTASGAGSAGYVVRGGEPVPIAHISARPTFDGSGSPGALEADVRDVGGGVTRVRFESFGTLELPDERNGILVTESGCAAWIDGEAGAGQWENERRLTTDA